jgi:hypothetical protein
LDWLKEQYKQIRGNAKWDLLKAICFASLYPLLQKLRNLNWDWLVFGGLFVVSFLLLLFLGQLRTPAQPNSQPARNATSSLMPTVSALYGVSAPPFDAKAYFKQAYYSPVTAEVEKNIRKVAAENEPNDREGFLVRFVGVGLVAFLHEQTWAMIYQSQLLMLSSLNANGLMPLTAARAYYDKAKVNFPQTYSSYSFEQWIGFMKDQQLVIQHPSDMLEITVRGKDFLKYLTHYGRSPSGRKF